MPGVDFTPDRWAEFQQDLRLFRGHMGKSRWGKMFMDHGFNATPVWLIFGRTLSNLGGDALAVNADMQKLRRTSEESRANA